MSYFLKKTTPSKKGEYLQIYQGYYIPKVGNRNKSYKKLGYVSDLKKQGIEDPIKYFQKEVDALNEKENSVVQIDDYSACKYAGHFLLNAMFNYLNLSKTIDLMHQTSKIQYKMSDLIRNLVFAQVVSPGSKLKAFEKVLPSLYKSVSFSYDQILDGIRLIGINYEKYIELLNFGIQKNWNRKTKNVFFDCTNYYFEIDLEKDDRKKGPSKENRHDPIVSQALLLDSEQIPIGMSMFPGNESEKPQLRKMIEETKERFDIKGRIVQVADKGLNCARNIYAAVKEANDGYIFSRSVHGKNLNEQEKKWIKLENDENIWVNVTNDKEELLFKYKACIDDFEYNFIDEITGEKISFKVKEKRVVTYNPSFARKQIKQIRKEIEKAREKISIKSLARDEFGDCAKYVNFIAVDKNGKQIKIAKDMNEDKIKEDLSLAGFNLLVTSEIDLDPKEIYRIYHGLWRIEESFKIMKSYLEARPAYLQTKESIYGHFLVCYYGLTILRLLELKIFNDELPVNQIIDFIRDYKVTAINEGCYINNATNSRAFKFIKEKLSLSKLGNLNLKTKDLENLFNYDF